MGVKSFCIGLNRLTRMRIEQLKAIKNASSGSEVGKWAIDVAWFLALYRPQLLKEIEEEITRRGLWSCEGAERLGER